MAKNYTRFTNVEAEEVKAKKIDAEEIDGIPDASATDKGLVKQAANVAACTPAGSTATSCETQFNALLTALKAAGIVAADA